MLNHTISHTDSIEHVKQNHTAQHVSVNDGETDRKRDETLQIQSFRPALLLLIIHVGFTFEILSIIYLQFLSENCFKEM